MDEPIETPAPHPAAIYYRHHPSGASDIVLRGGAIPADGPPHVRLGAIEIESHEGALLVRIGADGSIMLGHGVEPEEAAIAFLQAIAARICSQPRLPDAEDLDPQDLDRQELEQLAELDELEKDGPRAGAWRRPGDSSEPPNDR